MKKIFSILAVAAIVLSMASCGLGGTDRYADGKTTPSLDPVNGYVNGTKHDTKENKCWIYTKTLKDSHGDQTNTTRYLWETEYDVYAEAETELYVAARNGYSGHYIIALVLPEIEDSEECLSKNE